jgi:hypothetical protein
MYSYFKVSATTYCDSEREGNHTPGEERVLLFVSYKNQ